MKKLQTIHGNRLTIYKVTDIEGMTDKDIIEALGGQYGGQVTRNGNTATVTVYKQPTILMKFKTVLTIGG